MANDVYYSIEGETSRELKVKGSRFMGYALPAHDRQQAESFVQEISRKHYDASHHCFAYRLGVEDPFVFRYGDGGEPSGTGGKPILEAIHSRSLTCIVCVVARYFGGTKLGTGGLARAYGHCAAITLDAGNKVKRYVMEAIRIAFAYDLTGVVMNLIASDECQIINTRYDSEVEMNLRVRRSHTDPLQQKLINATSGRVKIFRGEVTGL